MTSKGCLGALVIACLLIVGRVHGGQSPKRTARSQLKADLRSRREAFGLISPADDATNFVKLTICFWPFAIIQVDEVKQTVTTLTSFFLTWTDPDLIWNASDYSNISRLIEDVQSLWQPTITIPNSADNENLVLKRAIDKVMVFNNGTVSYFTTTFLNTYCELDLTSYPFDEQKCHILIIPFVDDSLFSVNAVSVTLQPPYRFSGEWSILGRLLTMENYVDFTGYNLTMVRITLRLKRSSTYYIFSIVIPLLLMSFMTPIVFWVPPSSGERVSYLVSIFLSMTVYLSYVVSTLPRSINRMPKVLIFLIVIMAQTFVTIVGTVIVAKKHAHETADAQSPRPTRGGAEGKNYRDRARKKNQVMPDSQNSQKDQTTKEGVEEVLNEYDVTSGPQANNGWASITSRQLDKIFFTLFYVTCIPLYIFIIFF